MGLRQKAAMWLLKQAFNLNTKALNGTSSIGGFAVYSPYSTFSNIDRYITIDSLYSVVKFRARTAGLIPFRVYKIKNQQKLKEYQYKTQMKDFTTQGMVRKLLLKFQAMEEVDDNNELQKLLDNPNQTYSKYEFWEGVYTSLILSGNTYILTGVPELGVNAGKVKEMYLMPPQYTAPVVEGNFPKYITGYQLNMNGIANYKKEEVMHLRYFNPEFGANGSELVGLSPLTALHKTLERGKSENDFMVSAFQNSGASGLVNFEELDANDTRTSEALGKLKSEYYTNQSGVRNAQKNIFHAGKSSFTQIGLGPVDMKVIESQKITFKQLCNALFVSDVLFNNGEASTESNVKEMVKRMYTNACLPDAYSVRDMLNARLTPMFNKGGATYYIDVDITGISELQEDMKAMAETFSALPIMNPAWITEAMGYGTEDKSLDKIYVKTGYTLLDDLSVNDLPSTPDYGNSGQ